MITIVVLVSLLALLFAGYLALTIKKKDEGTDEMKRIAALIKQGAITFLNKQYRYLSVFVVLVAFILAFIVNLATAIAFLLGGILSGLSGYVGMRISTASGARTANAVAVKENVDRGLRLAFSSGGVMGMTVVGLGLLGITILYSIFQDPKIMYGFGFGASSIALFARVAGGVYTKAADIGADLVGKIEAHIPEDDPRNPGVIADNVGDNVGDVAGMGADLFESYVDSIIAAMAIGVAIVATFQQAVILPLLISAIGILSSIIGYFFVRTKESSEKKLHGVLNRGIYIATIITAVLSYLLITHMGADIGVFYAMLSGLLVGTIIGFSTQYYTDSNFRPTKDVAQESVSGDATNIISGLALGMESITVPVIAVSASMVLSYYLADMYGIAMAAVGMLSTLGITLAADCYGPVADNAAGISEMAGLGKNVREKCERLDAIGNSTAAMGKGFAIGSAALTVLALFSAYIATTGLSIISLTKPVVVAGVFIGGALPFIFSAFTMRSIGKTASKLVNEIRRQFKDKDILKGKKPPKYDKCIDLSTHSALKEMIWPAMMAILAPILVGLIMGTEALGGLLLGSITTGFMLAVMMANSGAAWDNAKKFIEEGNLGGKGSNAHKAAITGDTVGDPFKDCSGPSLNILIKLMGIVSLLLAASVLA